MDIDQEQNQTQITPRATRPPVEAVDLDRASRPGVPRERPPQPWPNSRFPPQRMTTPSSVPRHGRPGKQMPPVYSTAVPLHGVSGLIRRLAYRYPDHYVSHWMLLLFADRVDSWGTRARRVLPVALPLLAIGVVASRLGGSRR
jgi:hypothetical protein